MFYAQLTITIISGRQADKQIVKRKQRRTTLHASKVIQLESDDMIDFLKIQIHVMIGCLSSTIRHASNVHCIIISYWWLTVWTLSTQPQQSLTQTECVASEGRYYYSTFSLVQPHYYYSSLMFYGHREGRGATGSTSTFAQLLSSEEPNQKKSTLVLCHAYCPNKFPNYCA